MEDRNHQIRNLTAKYESLKNKSGILKSRSKFFYASSAVALVLTFATIFTGSRTLSDMGCTLALTFATVGLIDGARSHIKDTAAEQVSEEILTLKEEEME